MEDVYSKATSRTPFWMGWLSKIRFFPFNPVLPIVVIGAFIIMALAANFLAPYAPNQGVLADHLQPPAMTAGGSAHHLLGTDRLGRDILSRIIFGSRISLSVAALAIGVGATVGVLIGLISGMSGGIVDAILMRFVDIGLSIPTILIAIVLGVVIGPGFGNVIIILGLTLWPRFSRQLRAEALAARHSEYVDLARTAGCSTARIIVKHIFPNVVPTILVLCTLQVGYVIVLEASLSFLGVGVPPPQPSWGSMVADGRSLVSTAWWISAFPGIAILLIVLSLNFLGDWVRDRLDPKLRQV